MAIREQLDQLRRMINEPDSVEPYTDEQLSGRMDSPEYLGKPITALANAIWREKAAGYAELTDISEGGSSRSASKLYQQALDMAAVFAPAEPAASAVNTRPMNRKIERF